MFEVYRYQRCTAPGAGGQVVRAVGKMQRSGTPLEFEEGDQPVMLERIKNSMRAPLDDESGEGAQGDEDGFTLVELLIVVVVLGILAAVTVFGLSGTTSTSYKAACNADARSVEVAVEAYHTNNSPQWPASIDVLTQKDAKNNDVVYLRTKPNSPKYTIDTDGAGQVRVNGVPYDAGVNSGANPCQAVPG